MPRGRGEDPGRPGHDPVPGSGRPAAPAGGRDRPPVRAARLLSRTEPMLSFFSLKNVRKDASRRFAPMRESAPAGMWSGVSLPEGDSMTRDRGSRGMAGRAWAVLCRCRAHHGGARTPGDPDRAASRARGFSDRGHRDRDVGLLRGDACGLDPVPGPRPAGRTRPGVRRARFPCVGVRPHARPVRGGRVLDHDAGGDRILLRRHVRRRGELAESAGDPTGTAAGSALALYMVTMFAGAAVGHPAAQRRPIRRASTSFSSSRSSSPSLSSRCCWRPGRDRARAGRSA